MIALTEVLNAKILIVDDQQSNVLLLEQMLLKEGYRNVLSTMNPVEVCALHQEHDFDLILLDLQMPEMDGFQVMDGMKEIERHGYAPILVITAQPGHKLRALNAGAKDFISKPIEAVEFQTRVRNMLEVRLLYKKLENYNVLLEHTVQERTAQLSASEARFKNFTELTSDWYWEQDDQGRFTTVSGPVFEMLGIASGSEESAFIPAEGNEAELANLKYNIANRRPFFDFVYTLQKADGKTRHLQVSGEPMFDASCRFIGYRGVGVEITDRHYAFRKEANFRKAVDVIGFGLCLINRHTMNILDMNDVMCSKSGFGRTDLQQRALPDLQVGSAEQLSSVFDAVLAKAGAQYISGNMLCADGSLCAVRVDFHSFLDDADAVMVGTFDFSPAP